MKPGQAIPLNVDEYISTYPKDVQQVLLQLRALIKKAAPGATELISYRMPAYKLNGALVYFAAHKNHIGFYATPTGHKAFIKDLAVYNSGKGSVQFPLDNPLPKALITRIVKFRVQQNLEKARGKS